MSLPPAPAVQQTAAAINTAQTASTSSTTPVIGGVVYGVSANTINIQGGSGCGYVNVSYSGSTQIVTNGYSLTPGVFASVYGSGNCGTSFSATKITLSATTVAVAGPIYGVSATTINLQGGAGCGFVNVSYGSNTAVFLNGYSLAAGTYATVYGTGTCGTSFAATRIVLSGGASASAGAPASSASPTPTPSATHTATPTPTPSPTPTPTPTAPPNVLSHVLTADYCCGGYNNDTPSGGVATAKPWITYFANPSANSDPTGTYPSYGTPGLSAAGIPANRVYAYVDDSRVYRGDAQYNNIAPGGVDASAGALDCSGNRITENGNNGYLSDPYQPATAQLYDNDISTNHRYSSEYGLFFLDDINGYLYNDNGAMPCHLGIPWSQPGISSTYASLIASISISGFSPSYLLNALTPILIEANGSAAVVQAEISALTSLASVLGIDCEGCFADNTSAAIGNATSGEISNQWTLVEDAAIALVNAHKVFWVQDQDTHSTGSTSYAGRTYAFASFMLTWDPSYTVYQNAYYGYVGDGAHPNASNPQIHVFPEEALVAYNPVVPYPSTSSGIGALQDAGGTYVREYQTCFYAGTSIGACAFVVNPDAVSHSKPTLRATYNHTLVISSQYDVLDGGTVSLSGAAMPSTVAPATAYILVP